MGWDGMGYFPTQIGLPAPRLLSHVLEGQIFRKSSKLLHTFWSTGLPHHSLWKGPELIGTVTRKTMKRDSEDHFQCMWDAHILFNRLTNGIKTHSKCSHKKMTRRPPIICPFQYIYIYIWEWQIWICSFQYTYENDKVGSAHSNIYNENDKFGAWGSQFWILTLLLRLVLIPVASPPYVPPPALTGRTCPFRRMTALSCLSCRTGQSRCPKESECFSQPKENAQNTLIWNPRINLCASLDFGSIRDKVRNDGREKWRRNDCSNVSHSISDRGQILENIISQLC